MLRLKLPTDPRWVDIAQKNINEILTDHAYCEQKAASAAISFIVQYPEYPELVDAMSDLAREEIEHFQIWQFVVLTVNLMLISYTQNLKMHLSHALDPSQDKNSKKKCWIEPLALRIV